MNIQSQTKDGSSVSFALGEDYPELRDAVRRITAKYPGEYWRGLEERSEYPTAFVKDLTDGGYLAALIPEEYGGGGLPIRAAAAILEEINVGGCTATQCHAQMYIMGTLLRHGNAEQKKQYLAKFTGDDRYHLAFAGREPGAGAGWSYHRPLAADAAEPVAEKKGGDWVINGALPFVANATVAKLLACAVKPSCAALNAAGWLQISGLAAVLTPGFGPLPAGNQPCCWRA